MNMKLLVGLGNPEPRYENTRHNAGFALVDRFASKYGAEFRANASLQGSIARVKHSCGDLIILKPLTYMNLSGRAVQSVLHWFNADPACMLVVHDDVSLPLGVIRFQKGGGAGGQHGVESIMSVLAGKIFERLKIGVGPDPGGARRADYVLSVPPPEDFPLYQEVLAVAVEAVDDCISLGISKAMNKYNAVNLAVREQRSTAD